MAPQVAPTIRVSVDGAGNQVTSESRVPALSADGRLRGRDLVSVRVLDRASGG